MKYAMHATVASTVTRTPPYALLAMAALALLVSGCAVGPTYQLPTTARGRCVQGSR